MDCTSPVFGLYPCGNCTACRARSRQEWVFRLRMEYRSSDFGLFVTLTYDDDHLPPGGVCKRDVQLFLKRLRKHWKSMTLRYYIVSEYGDHTYRPHYHALLFFKGLKRDYHLYDIITSAWQNGHCEYGEIEEGSIVYCTKYCLKGSDVPPGKESNFRMLSKMNGGIGVDYINRKFSFHFGNIDRPQMVSQGKCASPMPRYYRTRLLKSLDDDSKEEIKQMYKDYIDRLKAHKQAKEELQFKVHHPEAYYESYIDQFGNQRYNIDGFAEYKILQRSIKCDLINNRTKKQTKI